MIDELIAHAELGEEAKNFLQGNLGKYLMGCADQELEQARIDFEGVDPNDPQAIREIQNRAWRAKKFGEWLVELVSNGENAKQVFLQQQQDG